METLMGLDSTNGLMEILMLESSGMGSNTEKENGRKSMKLVN